MSLQILKTITDDLNGTYTREPEKRVYLPGGVYISQNIRARFVYQNTNISVFMYINKGVKDLYDKQGSPYRIVIHSSKRFSLRVAPIDFWDKIGLKLGLIKGEKMGSKLVQASDAVISMLKQPPSLSVNLMKRRFGMYTEIDDSNSAFNTKLIIRPNESILTEIQLMKFVDLGVNIVATVP